MHGEMHLRPWEIDRLILPEMELALSSDLQKPFGGVTLGSPEEMQEYIAWWRCLSWEERIEEARG